MIPRGVTVCREVFLNGRSYVMYIVVEEEGRSVIFITNCDELLMGSVTATDITILTKKLGFNNLKNLSKLFRNCIQQNKYSYNSEASKLTFSLLYSDTSEELIIALKLVPENEKREYLKSLLCRMAQEISAHEDTAASSPATSLTSTLSTSTHPKMNKRRILGMSIINPGTKRVCTGSGVQFEEG